MAHENVIVVRLRDRGALSLDLLERLWLRLFETAPEVEGVEKTRVVGYSISKTLVEELWSAEGVVGGRPEPPEPLAYDFDKYIVCIGNLFADVCGTRKPIAELVGEVNASVLYREDVETQVEAALRVLRHVYSYLVAGDEYRLGPLPLLDMRDAQIAVYRDADALAEHAAWTYIVEQRLLGEGHGPEEFLDAFRGAAARLNLGFPHWEHEPATLYERLVRAAGLR